MLMNGHMDPIIYHIIMENLAKNKSSREYESPADDIMILIMLIMFLVLLTVIVRPYYLEYKHNREDKDSYNDKNKDS